ncbi:hypothetical protein AMTR_s00161p00045530 [Amborella trichopoda]|uniref:Uncharacterized protein n=1 Tax=Amborella trichopoda TaxID=13333 RepID=W1PT64_AMBTC|nr:hypothetical protein AMTR_s00161p00045530 [Amborella trichopoda]
MKVQFQETTTNLHPCFWRPLKNPSNPVAGFRPNSPEIWQRPGRLRGSAKDNELNGDGGWPKSDLQLSRKEKEDDFLAMGEGWLLDPRGGPSIFRRR